MSSLVTVPADWYLNLRKQFGMAPLYVERAHAKQKAFILDEAPRSAALCGRRGGKTRALAPKLLRAIEKRPGERAVYITLTRSRSRQIMWDGALERMAKELRLPIELRTRDGQLMVEHENGSSIWLAGCSNKAEIDKFRGEGYVAAAIDEAMAFPEWLENLIEDALTPALGDFNGPLILAGTASPLCAGYFYEVTSGLKAGWSTHHWDCRSNPYLADGEGGQDMFDGARIRYGEDSPTFRREWIGEWVDDPEALVYPLRWPHNGFTAQAGNPYGLPEGSYTFGLGVDIGFSEESTAFVLAAARRGTGEVYILRAWTRSRLTPVALAAHVAALRDKHKQEAPGAGLSVVMDEGALGKGYAEQARELGVHCEAAEKTRKRAYQEYVRGLISNGAVKVNWSECKPLIDETQKLEFDPETNEESEAYRRHCSDAFLYVVRKLFPRYDPKNDEPEPGSPEALRLEMERHKKKLAKELAKKNGPRNWKEAA